MAAPYVGTILQGLALIVVARRVPAGMSPRMSPAPVDQGSPKASDGRSLFTTAALSADPGSVRTDGVVTRKAKENEDKERDED
jgi:hypothetical protein